MHLKVVRPALPNISPSTMESEMPLDSMLVAAGVVLMFVCFAVPVAWAVRQTSRLDAG